LGISDEWDQRLREFVTEQKKFFTDIKDPGLLCDIRNNEEEIEKAFIKEGGFEDGITYFYCHGNTSDSLVDTYIKLTKERSINLLDLKNLLRGAIFKNNPLIFINACESLRMSPVFYDGFVPLFLDSGSCGVIGTIYKIPGIFASKFAIEFFKSYFRGSLIGSLLPLLRSEFYKKYNNCLGLLYTSYCSSNISLEKPLEI
jgi:hypothetical protein